MTYAVAEPTDWFPASRTLFNQNNVMYRTGCKRRKIPLLPIILGFIETLRTYPGTTLSKQIRLNALAEE
jgi:hypothetical protein